MMIGECVCVLQEIIGHTIDRLKVLLPHLLRYLPISSSHLSRLLLFLKLDPPLQSDCARRRRAFTTLGSLTLCLSALQAIPATKYPATSSFWASTISLSVW